MKKTHKSYTLLSIMLLTCAQHASADGVVEWLATGVALTCGSIVILQLAHLTENKDDTDGKLRDIEHQKTLIHKEKHDAEQEFNTIFKKMDTLKITLENKVKELRQQHNLDEYSPRLMQLVQDSPEIRALVETLQAHSETAKQLVKIIKKNNSNLEQLNSRQTQIASEHEGDQVNIALAAIGGAFGVGSNVFLNSGKRGL